MIADMLSNQALNPMVTALFIRGIKLNFTCFYYTILICCAKRHQTKFYALFYYENSKLIRTSTNWIHNSSDIDLEDFMNLYKKCTVKTYSFLSIDPTIASDNPLRFKKNLIERI